MEAEDFMDDGIEIRKTISKLIVCWIWTMLEKFISQLDLNVRVS